MTRYLLSYCVAPFTQVCKVIATVSGYQGTVITYTDHAERPIDASALPSWLRADLLGLLTGRLTSSPYISRMAEVDPATLASIHEARPACGVGANLWAMFSQTHRPTH